jgi:hypothetical protein
MVGHPSITDSPGVPSTGTLTKVNNGEGSDDRSRREDSEEFKQSHWEQSIADRGPTCTPGARKTEHRLAPRIQRHFRPATLDLVRPSSARCVDSDALNSYSEMPFDISQIHRDLLRERQEPSRIQRGGVSAAHWWCGAARPVR